MRKAEAESPKKIFKDNSLPTFDLSNNTKSAMADLDEDAALNSSLPRSHDDHDADDETQDFRILAALTSKSGQLPKRGEKDFEPHGTKHQDGILAASRQAMHDVLDYTRIHTSKQDTRAFYYGEEGIPRDEIIPEKWRLGLDKDHTVVVESSKGPHFRTMGKMATGQKNPALWLLPEEALFLVERGSMDLWWPGQRSFTGISMDSKQVAVANEETEDFDEGIPMSLQEAYAMLIGRDGERGKVSLERYTVYANLKRNGYVVFRAPDWDPDYLETSHHHSVLKAAEESQRGLFTWLFGHFFAEKCIEHSAHGPLVKPGMYRSYNKIYQQIAIIPRHKPSPNPKFLASPGDPYRLAFHLWKPTRIPTFAKSNPGLPDFRVAVIDARSTPIPTLTQVSSLLESTPWNPPQSQLEGPGIGKFYQRLKHGWRNVILAVIDQGVISYSELCEGAFGEEQLFENFDRGNIGNSKRGGGAGRGRGKGRGRGRGRARGGG